LAAYKAVEKPAWAAYEAVHKPAWAAYKDGLKQLEKEYSV
jgi:hypothetical protein